MAENRIPPNSAAKPAARSLKEARRAVLPAEAVRSFSLKRPPFAAGPHRLGSGSVGMQVRVGERGQTCKILGVLRVWGRVGVRVQVYF